MTIILTHTVKPSRKDAFGLACKARTHHLTDREIDSLINYFAPSVPATPKTAFQWVARAVGFNDVRKYLEYVFVVDGVMVATDGHRLHHAATDLKNGFYDPKTGLPVEVDGRYPEWRRIIPRSGSTKAPEKWENMTVTTNRKPEFVTLIDNRSFLTKYLDEALATRENVMILDEGWLSKVTGDCRFGTFVIACRRD